MLLLSLLLPNAHADRGDCDNLLAVRIALRAEAAPLIDCAVTTITAPVAAYADCAGKTANQCAWDRWDDPQAYPLLVPAVGTLQARYAPRCRDGTDVCGPEDEVRCVDGSRPVYWVEQTGSPIWVVHFRGGDSCRENVQPNGVTKPVADDCHDNYFGANGEDDNLLTMTSAPAQDHLEGLGILDPTQRFGGFNRVLIHKCSFDWYLGDQVFGGQVDQTGQRFDLFFDGRRVIQAVLADLGIGAGDPLILSGSSSGAASLVHNIDWIRDTTGAEVRGVLASYFRPSLELEATCGDTDCTGGSAYSGTLSGTSAWTVIDAYDETPYLLPGGRHAEWLGTWSPSTLDTSCASHHPSDPWQCQVTEHVLLDHVTTPIFVYQSTRDSVFTTGNDDGSVVDFDQGPGPTFVRWDAAHFQPRVEAQAFSFALDGVDAGLREEPFDTSTMAHPLGLFLRDTARHEVIVTTDEWYTEACLAAGPFEVDLLDAVAAWLGGRRIRLADGVGPWAGSTSCVP